MKHGQKKFGTVKTGDGDRDYCKKFCVLHSWVDLFSIGGESRWNDLHGDCDLVPIDGVGAEFEPPKHMRKAA